MSTRIGHAGEPIFITTRTMQWICNENDTWGVNLWVYKSSLGRCKTHGSGRCNNSGASVRDDGRHFDPSPVHQVCIMLVIIPRQKTDLMPCTIQDLYRVDIIVIAHIPHQVYHLPIIDQKLKLLTSTTGSWRKQSTVWNTSPRIGFALQNCDPTTRVIEAACGTALSILNKKTKNTRAKIKGDETVQQCNK